MSKWQQRELIGGLAGYASTLTSGFLPSIQSRELKFNGHVG